MWLLIFCYFPAAVGNPALKSTERTLKAIIEASKFEFTAGRRFEVLQYFSSKKSQLPAVANSSLKQLMNSFKLLTFFQLSPGATPMFFLLRNFQRR
jgi:hypothetical protein